MQHDTGVRKRTNVRDDERWRDSKRRKQAEGTKCKGEETPATEERGMRQRGIAWGLVPVLNISITDWVGTKNAFDPDSKGLLQNKHFFELAAAQWDSPREKVQRKALKGRGGKKKKNFSRWVESLQVSYLHYVVESFIFSSFVLFQDERCHMFCMCMKHWAHANFEEGGM